MLALLCTVSASVAGFHGHAIPMRVRQPMMVQSWYDSGTRLTSPVAETLSFMAPPDGVACENEEECVLPFDDQEFRESLLLTKSLLHSNSMAIAQT